MTGLEQRKSKHNYVNLCMNSLEKILRIPGLLRQMANGLVKACLCFMQSGIYPIKLVC